MKRFILLAAVLCAPAYATNVLYSPVSDPATHKPSIIYLTDEHSHACQGKWYAAKMVDSASNKPLPINPTCWAFNDNYGWDIWIPSVGQLQTAVGNFGAVPNAGSAWIKLIQANTARRQQEMRELTDAYQQAAPHP